MFFHGIDDQLQTSCFDGLLHILGMMAAKIPEGPACLLLNTNHTRVIPHGKYHTFDAAGLTSAFSVVRVVMAESAQGLAALLLATGYSPQHPHCTNHQLTSTICPNTILGFHV